MTLLILEPENSQQLNNLCGALNCNLTMIEQSLNIEINNAGNRFNINGEKKSVGKATKLLGTLYQNYANTHLIDAEIITQKLKNMDNFQPTIIIKVRNKIIKARSNNQDIYLSKILDNAVNFGIGPAGTGKTYLAVASAVNAFNKKQIERIILVRPAVEAGEKLGFLPGDLADKVDPYLRPLYDALYEMLGTEKVDKLIEKRVIEVAPLAFMRGRTLNNAFILLDEAQNTTVSQMKMFLTRLGFGSTAIIAGDLTQIDLSHRIESGLKDAVKILSDIDGVHFSFFDQHDIVRHPLVQKIVSAYESK